MEQANNLYYLKSEEHDRGDRGVNSLNDIPVQSIDLQVPLKIPGLASSDKYLEVKKQKDRKTKKRKTKKSKSKRDADFLVEQFFLNFSCGTVFSGTCYLKYCFLSGKFFLLKFEIFYCRSREKFK